MWRNSHASPAGERGARRGRGGLVTAILLALALEILGPSATRAAPASAQQTGSLTLSPARLTLCKGKSATVSASGTLLTARGRGRRPSRQPVPAATVSSHSQGANVASIAPSGGSLGGRGRASVAFTVTGNEVGTTTIVIILHPPGAFAGDSELAPLVPWQETRKSLTVTVKECNFIVGVFSTWTIPRGWIYRLTSGLVADVVPDQDGRFVVGTTVENHHRQLIPIGGPCGKTATVDMTRAEVKGFVDDDGILDFEVKYDPVRAAKTDIRCRTPVGVIGAGAVDSGSFEVYDPQPVSIRTRAGVANRAQAASGTFPQVICTAFGDIQGRGIYVIIVR